MNQELSLGFYHTFPLWIDEQFEVQQFEFPKIEFSKFVPTTINQRLRLGHQMECVFEQLISSSGYWKTIAKNILVNEGATRVGELDFILENTITEAIYHIELVYKFYIVNPEIQNPTQRLIGPNNSDAFLTKLDKLRKKQFPLLYANALSHKLTKLGINISEVKQQACFKAQLFMPYGDTPINIGPLNKNCIVGKWIRFNEFNTKAFKSSLYYIPIKKEWVIAPTGNRIYGTHSKTLPVIERSMLKERSPMLWMKKSGGTIEKLFVVWW
ncbi:MAG: DUF1853 family protein [Flavobacteriaceae bacterium]